MNKLTFNIHLFNAMMIKCRSEENPISSISRAHPLLSTLGVESLKRSRLVSHIDNLALKNMTAALLF